MSSIFSLIRTNYHQMSSSQKGVADYVLNNSDKIILNTLSETAKACAVSEPTVLRFLQKIKFHSYQIFRIELAQEIAGDDTTLNSDDIALDDSPEMIKQKIIQATSKSILDSATVIESAVIECIARRIISARRILIIGVGASGAIAFDLFHKLIKLGLNVVQSNDAHMINILGSALGKEDYMIAISHSGESREILDAIQLAKDVHCSVGAITSYSKSSLAEQADEMICSSSFETHLRSDAMTSRIIQLMIIDMLYLTCMKLIGPNALKQVHKSRLVVSKNKT